MEISSLSCQLPPSAAAGRDGSLVPAALEVAGRGDRADTLGLRLQPFCSEICKSETRNRYIGVQSNTNHVVVNVLPAASLLYTEPHVCNDAVSSHRALFSPGLSFWVFYRRPCETRRSEICVFFPPCC